MNPWKNVNGLVFFWAGKGSILSISISWSKSSSPGVSEGIWDGDSILYCNSISSNNGGTGVLGGESGGSSIVVINNVVGKSVCVSTDDNPITILVFPSTFWNISSDVSETNGEILVQFNSGGEGKSIISKSNVKHVGSIVGTLFDVDWVRGGGSESDKCKS